MNEPAPAPANAPASPAPPPTPPQRASIWRRVGEVLAGSALGFVTWSIVGPGMIGWWYEPPSKDAFSCAGTVRSALGQFVAMQMVSAVVGATILGVGLFFIRRWWSKRRAAH